jgi:hypothetical protein
MWVLTYPIGVYAIINTEILPNLLRLTASSLTSSLTLMAASYGNPSINQYKDTIESLDIEFKLNMVYNWLNQINPESIKEGTNIYNIYNGLIEICDKLSKILGTINQKLNYHNSLWFKNWRTIDLTIEITRLTKLTNILSERLNILPFSCMMENMEQYKKLVIEDDKIPDLSAPLTPGEDEYINLN